jgi:hypothetical protein
MSNCSTDFRIMYNLLKLVVTFPTHWKKLEQVNELIMTR